MRYRWIATGALALALGLSGCGGRTSNDHSAGVGGPSGTAPSNLTESGTGGDVGNNSGTGDSRPGDNPDNSSGDIGGTDGIDISGTTVATGTLTTGTPSTNTP
ncbi:MAG TPA: hypothetical protein VFS21_30095 [Roseiflexaceae bacterium]|nr:hypothetical protein [Roseiflexaceae bacterium]